MTYDAIIFDIDGTLWDARESITRSWNCTIRQETGLDDLLETESFGALFGRPLDELIDIALADLPEAGRQALGRRCAAGQNDHLRRFPGRVYSGVPETLTVLAERWPLYIVSNCGTGYIEAMLDGTGLRSLFRGWMCYADTNAPKDVTIRVLMERYGLNRPVYVGDIQADADACARAEVDIIHAAYGLGTIEHPTARIERFSDLTEVLK